eukprot:TRINITY_DN2533_c0_g1_i3.p3 TRINITY_DN2533_c0_g1~~TRINITY_DN2533_c0_g1_i3.p3  ORF type:complete len:201 (+),score=-11.85 TRINITY_DN2533_c0_g1_i3:94-696(+)
MLAKQFLYPLVVHTRCVIQDRVSRQPWISFRQRMHILALTYALGYPGNIFLLRNLNFNHTIDPTKTSSRFADLLPRQQLILIRSSHKKNKSSHKKNKASQILKIMILCLILGRARKRAAQGKQLKKEDEAKGEFILIDVCKHIYIYDIIYINNNGMTGTIVIFSGCATSLIVFGVRLGQLQVSLLLCYNRGGASSRMKMF